MSDMITGTIVTTNPKNLTLTCEDDFGRRYPVAVSATATVTRNGEDCTLKDLREKDAVEFSHDSPVSVVKARGA